MSPGSCWAAAGGRHFPRRILAASQPLHVQIPATHLPIGLRRCSNAAPSEFTRKGGTEEAISESSLWTRFVQWSYGKLGRHIYPAKADICNCGVDLQIQLPQPELIKRDGVEVGSLEWRMQFYGAALYWHAATTPREKMKKADPDMFRGKDVLEVACMRGGGARYLAEVAGPRSYVAVDNVQEHIDACNSKPLLPNLRFEYADALALSNKFEPASFDVVLCVQAVASFDGISKFVRDASRLLRPGGRLIICDALVRDKFKSILDGAEENGLKLDVCVDLSRAVHAVGICKVPTGISYLHIVARKAEEDPEQADRQAE